MIHDRAMIWELVNRIPVQVRDDGAVRMTPEQMSPEQKLMAFLNSQK
jgi:hypothetical protein